MQDFNLEQFRAMLRKGDAAIGATDVAMFDNEAKALGNGEFSYTFDGVVPVKVKIWPQGVIYEWPDTQEHEVVDERDVRFKKYDNEAAWLVAMELELRDWYQNEVMA